MAVVGGTLLNSSLCRVLAAVLVVSLVACTKPADTVTVERTGSNDDATGRKLAPRMSVKDHRGRQLDVPTPGRITVVSFASKNTVDRASALCRAVRVAHPQVMILELIDVSSAPGFLASKIESKLANRHATILADTKQAFADAEQPVPADLEDRIHIVPDWSATAFEAYGADAGDHAQIAVVGPEGAVVAFFAATPTKDELLAAVALASSSH